jgi:transposase
LIEAISAIIDESPELYLDEITDRLARETGLYLSVSTIRRILTEKLNLSLQVCNEVARQMNELQRYNYRMALEALVQHPKQVIVLDETHKDKNASRRRRCWQRRNVGGLGVRRWFNDNVNYSMIAAMNWKGFIDSTIKLTRRDEISEEGAAGTVNALVFQNWVRDHLCPTLGRYTEGEPNSIVIMDNASTHMSEEVKDLIEGTGAYLLYTAPYSPDLSPIEYMFSVYKSNLKRYSIEYNGDQWYELHLRAIYEIDEVTALKQFRKCGIPYSCDILTPDEFELKFIEFMDNLLSRIQSD